MPRGRPPLGGTESRGLTGRCARRRTKHSVNAAVIPEADIYRGPAAHQVPRAALHMRFNPQSKPSRPGSRAPTLTRGHAGSLPAPWEPQAELNAQPHPLQLGKNLKNVADHAGAPGRAPRCGPQEGGARCVPVVVPRNTLSPHSFQESPVLAPKVRRRQSRELNGVGRDHGWLLCPHCVQGSCHVSWGVGTTWASGQWERRRKDTPRCWV